MGLTTIYRGEGGVGLLSRGEREGWDLLLSIGEREGWDYYLEGRGRGGTTI